MTGSRYPAARVSIQPISIAPTMTPAMLSSPPMITIGKTLSPDQHHVEAAAGNVRPQHAGRDRDHPGKSPHEGECRPHVDAHGKGRLAVVRHAPQGDALAGSFEEPAHHADERQSDRGRDELVGRQQHSTDIHRAARQRQLDVAGDAAEQERRDRAQNRAEPDGNHDHPDDRAPDEVTQHEPVEPGRDREHPGPAERERGEEGETHRIGPRGHDAGREHHELARARSS